MTNTEYGLKLNCMEYLKELYKNSEIGWDIKISNKNFIVQINGERALIKIEWVKNWLNNR